MPAGEGADAGGSASDAAEHPPTTQALLRVTVFAEVGYYEPWWIQILKALVIFAVFLSSLPVVIVAERKLLGRFQHRYGPNRVGPFGFAAAAGRHPQVRRPRSQCRPKTAGRLPVRASRRSISIVHGGRGDRRRSRSPTPSTSSAPRSASTGSTPTSAILYAFAFGAIAFYGLMLGGWASGSKYSFLGAMRSAAQLISYEVAQGLALVGVIMTAQDAVADGDRHRPGGRHLWYDRPAVRRLPHLPGRRRSPRPTARRSTSRRPTPSSCRAT